jgi:ABC-type phosphate transport system substrate-binding protein
MNEATIVNSYTVESKVVANWESGAFVGWTSAAGTLTNNYVAGANVATTTSSGGIFNGYAYAGTKFTGNVVYSGKLTNPNTTNQGRIDARENGTPTYSNNLSLSTATINGSNVSGGTATNKNGLNKTEAELQTQSTYTGIGWDFTNVWAWDSTLKRPVLKGVAEAAAATGPGTYSIGSEADMALLREHPDATFNLTADITMAKPWAPIPAFAGTLNGNGHTIKGLTVEGTGSKAFIDVNVGTIKQLGFLGLTSVRTGAYSEPMRVGGVTVVNEGTIEQVYTSGADVEGGWRTAPIAAMNEAIVQNSYTVNSTVVSNWESGALVGFNKEGAYVKNNYVAGANVRTIVSNGGLISGYGYVGSSSVAATKFEGDVVYSGALTIPSSAPQGRINGQEKNGTPTYANLLANSAATINGAAVSGGTATNKNGLNKTEAELQTQSTYTGIGWDFTNVWTMSPTLKRPVLKAVAEAQVTPKVTLTKAKLTYQVGSHPTDAELLKAAGAATSAGTLTIDSSAVNFAAAGEYTAQVGANNNGAEAVPVALTIRVVPVTQITVAQGSLTYPASATAPVTAAGVIADSGASAGNGATVTADVSTVNSDLPGDYTVTLHATDADGFPAEPVTVTVHIAAAPTQTKLVASGPTQIYRGGSPVKLTATVAGGDGTLVGSIELDEGSAKLGEAALAGGTAEFTLADNLALGSHELAAHFHSEEAASIDSASDPVTVTVETAQGCRGASITGAGTPLQGPAHHDLWAPAFAGHCPGGPTVGYQGGGSGPALTGWGFNGGAFDASKAFIGTDEAPTSAQIKAAVAASGSNVLVIPVAQTAIGIVVNAPAGCSIEEITNKQLESVMRGNIKIWNKIQTASGAGCVNAPITRVVRAEGSGTTYQLKNYLSLISAASLACTEGGRSWKQLEEIGAGDKPNTVWPESGVAGCSAKELSPVLTASGGAALVDKVNATEGGIGYAALPDIEAGKSGDTDWIKLQNNGVSNKLATAQTVSPVEEIGDSARCDSSTYGVPKTAKSNVADPAGSDWSGAVGSNPNIAGATGNTDAYPLCMLTYDVALSRYSKAGFSAAQEQTVAAYLAGIVTAPEGQEALETGKAFYAPLPDTTVPASDVLGAAQLAAGRIGF